MKHPAGKVHAAKPISQVVGPTFDKNDPAKIKNTTRASGKTKSNGVVDEATGPVFTCNETHIPSMNADIPAKEKEMKNAEGRVNISEHETTGDLTVSQRGSGEPTDRPYPLARSYEKSGKKGSVPNRAGR
jgi:hypothetical protein